MVRVEPFSNAVLLGITAILAIPRWMRKRAYWETSGIRKLTLYLAVRRTVSGVTDSMTEVQFLSEVGSDRGRARVNLRDNGG
jgi:hypothetical protein